MGKKRTKSASRSSSRLADTDSVRSSWKRILRWLDANAPELAASLSNGETASRIREFEKQLGRRLPDDFKESLRIYTRSAGIIPDPSRQGIGHNHAYGLMSLGEIYGQWQRLTGLYDAGDFDRRAERVKAAQGVVRQWWSASWIPFASNGAGDAFCIDLGPTWPGTRGQVVFVSHEIGIRPLIAASFSSLLSSLADEYESGNYQISDCGSIGAVRRRRTAFPDAGD